MTDANIEKAVAAVFSGIAKHDDHCWEQVGRCVYCVDCGVRLYQGRISKNHTNVRARRRQEAAKGTDEMRKLWGKDP